MARFVALLLAGLLVNATLGAATTIAFVLLCALVATCRVTMKRARQMQAEDAGQV